MGKKNKRNMITTEELEKLSRPDFTMFLFFIFVVIVIIAGILTRLNGNWHWNVVPFVGILVGLVAVVFVGESGFLKKAKKFIYLVSGTSAGVLFSILLNTSTNGLILGDIIGFVCGLFLTYLIEQLINVI